VALASETVACTKISVLEAEVSQYWKNRFLLLFVARLGKGHFITAFFPAHWLFFAVYGFFFAVNGKKIACNVKKIAGNVKKIVGIYCSTVIKAVTLKKNSTFRARGYYGALLCATALSVGFQLQYDTYCTERTVKIQYFR
jgi:hypothetical protein